MYLLGQQVDVLGPVVSDSDLGVKLGLAFQLPWGSESIMGILLT